MSQPPSVPARALTVLVVPRAHADDVVGVLTDYSAVGLVDPFAWVDGAAYAALDADGELVTGLTDALRGWECLPS